MQSAEHPEIRLSLGTGNLGPGTSECLFVRLLGPDEQCSGERFDLPEACLLKDFSKQCVTSAEVVNQHAVRGAGRSGQRTESIWKPVREGVVRARVEETLSDFRLRMSSHGLQLSRNDSYV